MFSTLEIEDENEEEMGEKHKVTRRRKKSKIISIIIS